MYGYFTCQKIGKYKVVDFVVEHNHPLQPLGYVHMIRSHRRISESQASQIMLADESGLKPKDFHEYVSKQFGGINVVGYTRQDHRNYLRTKRNHSLQYGEVGALLMYFKGQSENPSFFYDFQMDVEEQITNIFWDMKDGLYIVINYDDNKERKVMGNLEDQQVSCDCRKFETHGILCCHALKVLDAMNIKLISSHYILKRWKREARSGSNQDWKGLHINLDIKAHFMKRYNELCPRMVKLTNRAFESHETYTFLSKVYEESNKMINDMLAKKSMDGESIGMYNISISIANGEFDNNANTVDFVEAKGIKKKECSYWSKK